MNSFTNPPVDDTRAQRAELAQLVQGLVSGDGMSHEQLVTMADQRLYQAKHSGRNKVVAG